MLFTIDKGLLRKGIKDCNDILASTQQVKTDFELSEVRMLGMVDKSRRLRRVYLDSQEVMSSVGNTTLPLEFMVKRVQGLVDTVNAADGYVSNIVECSNVPEINITAKVEERLEEEGIVKEGANRDEVQSTETESST